jgi:DNA-directed RNA polymerase subunit M/transcription elongation factor TFIIS
MRFCKECDNMLQPKEEKVDDDVTRLVYQCRICGHRDLAKANDEADHCVYRSSEQQSLADGSGASESSGAAFFFQVDKECVKDPTLSRQKNVTCRKCKHNEAVTFTNPTKDRMNLIFVCTKCTFYWRKEEIDVVAAAGH